MERYVLISAYIYLLIRSHIFVHHTHDNLLGTPLYCTEALLFTWLRHYTGEAADLCSLIGMGCSEFRELIGTANNL